MGILVKYAAGDRVQAKTGHFRSVPLRVRRVEEEVNYELFAKLRRASSAMYDKVLVIGNGGREHAIVWKLAQSPRIQTIYVAPGNAGTSTESKAVNVDIDVKSNKTVVDWCKANGIALVAIGPEEYLCRGLADDLEAAGVKCFGPSAKAAEIEASKAFSKDFMAKHGIPTAQYQNFENAESAKTYIRNADFPALVVKASGLAAGKGVIVAADKTEAIAAIDTIMKDKVLGSAGDTVVVEELLDGDEISVLVFSDGVNYSVMPPAQDHKRLKDGDQGPNTGGMGAYCPCPLVSDQVMEQIRVEVVQRTLDGMRKDGRKFVGVLFAGIMLTKSGPKVLEFNCRFGDPETESVLPLLESDLYETMLACTEGNLPRALPVWKKNLYAVGVVLASGGYPQSYPKGKIITGLEKAREHGVQIFHAGTTKSENHIVTSGGRVMVCLATHSDLRTAKQLAQLGAEIVHFEGKFFRHDIAFRAIGRVSKKDPLTYSMSGVDIAAGDRLGAEPLFFLDYFACGKLDPGVAKQVIAGIAEGCRQAKCSLIGGETAEMPGMYAIGDYDLAGFSVGAVERDRVLPRSDIKDGDVIIGFPSSGIHSNGYSLVRKVVERAGLRYDAQAIIDESEGQGRIVGQILAIEEGSPKVNVRNFQESLNTRADKIVKKKFGVLISGSGTNLQALIDHIEHMNGRSAAEIVLVISNVDGVEGLRRAQRAGIPTKVISHKGYKVRAEHAGYQYCGACAAHAYKQVDPTAVRRVFILGPSHHARIGGCGLSPAKSYRTPLYDLTINQEVYEELYETGAFEEVSIHVDENEHSLEMHLPYIAKVMENQEFTIVPIIVGSLSPENEAFYGRLLSKYLADADNLFVISSDFCHWGARFHYQFYDKSWGNIHQSIEKLDKQGMSIIEELSPTAFTAYLKKYGNTICGRHPIGVLLNAVDTLQNSGNGHRMALKFLKYAQSSQCMSMSDSSVSYASAALRLE
ncbi:hypothetical protein HPB52_005022 [Rhipicephalus sanguineus]|uniref:ATP-grasp domain-containing protein n=1 Tax=Rhipicephalus sanguineus TaxID=34632 RepID=A0A9D4SQ04_RHISA|nr:hypothetical protein HPB52_005022 [Rhipicephalus sanguineus]